MENRNNIDNIETNTQPVVNSQPTPPPKEKLFSIILVAEVIVGAILISLFIYLNFFQPPSKKQIDNNTTNLPSQSVTNSEQPTKATEPATSPYKITWLDKPQKIESLNIFNGIKQGPDEEKIYFDEARFYLVANLGDGSQLINLFLPIDGMGKSDVNFRFLKSSNGEISMLRPSETQSYLLETINKYLSDKVKVVSLNFSELVPPESISIHMTNKSVYFNRGYVIQKTFDKLDNLKLIKSTDYGDLYVFYSPLQNNSDINNRLFYLKLKDWTVYNYELQPYLFRDDRTVNFSWLDNSTNSSFSAKYPTGCSNVVHGPEVIKNSSYLLNNKEKTGQIDSNTFVYQIKDPNNSYLKDLYSTYKTGRDSTTVISYEEFIQKKNHFLYQDFLGDWLIYLNEGYSTMAECGKPVIYLYPVKDTQVKVQVGAQITKSEPTYPQGGWLVTAKPNGKLTYQNQFYPYLFWEGLGNGLYPDYRNRGTLVSQKDLVSTIYKQLSQLGLNQKESADFMEFWQPKLPSSPYIRLTWLNTKDMDTLAPLWVTPRPDTSIRIFLEFQGLDKPIKLIPQTLSAPKRQGFTLVEWGGLLLTTRE